MKTSIQVFRLLVLSAFLIVLIAAGPPFAAEKP